MSDDSPFVELHLLTPADMSAELCRREVAHLMIVETPGEPSPGQTFKAAAFSHGCAGRVRSLFIGLTNFVRKRWPPGGS